jgi:DNA-binding XRE family transcriptional regulator
MEPGVADDAYEFGHSTRYVPNAFAGGVAQIPNNPLIAATFTAIFKGGPKARSLLNGWEVDQDGIIKYRHIGRRGGEIAIYFDVGKERTANRGALIAKQSALIESFNPLTADTLLAVLAQICERGSGNRTFYPLTSPVLVSTNAVLKYKGVKRWGWERSDLRRRVKHELELLSRLRFDVLQFPSWDPAIKSWNHKGVSVVGDKVIDVMDGDEIAVLLNNREKLLDATWSVRIGHWGRWWLNAQAKVWLGEVPQNLMEFDHRANRGAANLAKKIGISTTVLLEALKSRGYVERRIDHLLDAIGELPIMEARDSHWAGRTRDRFDEALMRLQEVGVFGNVTWLTAGGPGDLDRNKGWVDQWLGSKVRIYRKDAPVRSDGEDPPASGKQNARRRSRRVNGAAADNPFETGTSIRRQRIASSMTQSQLAKKLNISNAYLSKIENQKVPVTKAIMQKLSSYLGASD